MASDLFGVYDDILKSANKAPSQQLRGVVYSSADSNPDAEAGLHRLAQKTGLPVEALRADNGAEARRQAAAQAVELLPSHAPTTTRWLLQPAHAALANDDLDNLSALEKLVTAFRSGRQQQQQGRLAHQALVDGTAPTLEEYDLGQQVRRANRMMDRANDFGLLTAAQIGGQMVETAAKALPLALGAGMSAGTVAAVAGQSGPQVALPEEILTVPAAFVAAFGTGLTAGFLNDTRKVEAGHAWREIQAIEGDGVSIDPEVAANAAQTVGLINAAIEGLGLKILAAPFKAAIKRAVIEQATKEAGQTLTQLTTRRAVGNFAKAYGTQIGAETGTEVAQEVVNLVAEELAKGASAGYFDKATPEQVGARLWQIASTTAQGMAWLGLPGAGVSLRNDLQASQAAQQNQDFMAALGDTAKASKLRERLPQKFQDLVAQLTQGGAVENVFVPVEQWRSFWQERGSDPEAMARQVGADYAEALTTGGDVTIPLEAYAAQLAATEHHAELLQDVRLRQGDMTPREAEAFRATLPERLEELRQAGEATQDEGSSRQVYEDVLGQLLGMGRERSTAEREALLWQARYRARAERTGRDAFDLYQQSPVTIRRPLPEVLTRRDQIDTSIDPLLDRLRAGDLPDGAKVYGQSLVEFLRERGISDDRGDLSSMEVDKGRKPFIKKLLREDGLSLDSAGELLWEAGYFTERPTTAELLEAIDNELRGSPRYAVGAGSESLQMERASLDEFREYLDAVGIDLAAMSNEQVRERLQSESGTFHQTLAADKLGRITFSKQGRLIELLEKADLSTFLHESGHAWLEELRQDAQAEGAAEHLWQDWQTVADWLGIEAEAATIPVEAHETFARGIEAYLREGKAPSAELQPAFQRFKAWLLRIYQTMAGLNVKLTDEVRGVMDRLLATDAEIRQAEQLQGFAPIFTDAASAGMTEREFAAYRGLVERAHQEAEQSLQQKLLKELSREQEAWWKLQRQRVRGEVEAEAKQNPTYQAFQALTRGETFDGAAVPEGFKLSKAALVKMYGAPFVKNLPRSFQRIYTREGGLHPDEVAEVFGIASGDELVRQLANTPPMKQAIEAETDVRMRQTYGDMLNDGSLADEALRAVHSDYQGQVLRAELRALSRKQREVAPFLRAAREDEREARREMEAEIPPLQAFKLWAAQEIGAKPLRAIRPDLYLKAEQKAGRLAFEAAAKNDFVTAGQEKRKQLLNHYLYLEAIAAREEADAIVDYANRLQKKPSQSRIGKAGGDYLDQINGLLERYEFKPVTEEAQEQRRSLLDWAKQQEEMGLEPSITPELLVDARRRNYKDLPIDDLRALRDALKNIEHLAREANVVRIDGEEIELADALEALAASAVEHYDPKRLPIDRETLTLRQRAGETLSKLDASLIKAEQLIEWLDGGRIDGPWARLIFRPLAEAQSREFDLTKQYTQTLAELFEAYGKAKGNQLMEKVQVASLGEPLTRQAVIAVALNLGNESNAKKLQQGWGWSDAQLMEILEKLDGDDWRFVQSVWDAIETLWPQIAALEQRLTGVAPPKIEARELVTEHGTFRGGYYPVVYDSRWSAAGEKQSDAKGDQLFEAAYVRATTAKGHTKERIEGAAYPILLSLGTIPQHLAQVIHDLTHREAIVTANRLLTHKSTRAALNTTVGAPYHKMLKQWLANVANDRNIDQTGTEFWSRFFSGLRTNATIVGMGFRVTTMLTQILGLSQSLDIVKGRHLAKATADFLRHPVASAAWVAETSGEMRHRRNALDRDIRDGVRKLMGKKGARQWVQAKAFVGIALFDALVSNPTWMGAYAQATESGLSEADAIAQADRAVRLSQGAGGAKDLAAVQRGNELMKLFTMFYSYFSILYSRLRNAGRLKSIGEIGFADLAWKSLVMVAVPAILGELLTNRGPDDDEDPALWALRKVALYPAGALPIVRDMANAAGEGRPYQMTPLARALELTARLPGRAYDLAEGETDLDDFIFQSFDIPGYAFGLPTGQIKTTTRYIWDVWDGEITPEDGRDIIQGLLFGEKKGHNK